MDQNKTWLKGIPVNFVVEIGRDEKTIDEILNWRKGVTIQLGDSKSNVLNIYLNNKLYGTGSVLRKESGEMDLKVTAKILKEEEVRKCLEES